MEKDLWKVLENIRYKDAEELDWAELEEKIEKQMPNYDITSWAIDDYQSDSLATMLLQEVNWHLHRKETQPVNIQSAMWWTDKGDVSAFILAVETKKR